MGKCNSTIHIPSPPLHPPLPIQVVSLSISCYRAIGSFCWKPMCGKPRASSSSALLTHRASSAAWSSSYMIVEISSFPWCTVNQDYIVVHTYYSGITIPSVPELDNALQSGQTQALGHARPGPVQRFGLYAPSLLGISLHTVCRRKGRSDQHYYCCHASLASQKLSGSLCIGLYP
ncbi:hypothetical protein EDC01DRAFT_522720 [Geopyxis carbonaria]|nr:hypothetical protein EDC01DRAFT_522720 [Geopyxis carbonaria]